MLTLNILHIDLHALTKKTENNSNYGKKQGVILLFSRMFKIFKKSEQKSLIEMNEEQNTSYLYFEDNDKYRQFQVRIAGITFTNDDGSSRSKIASKCRYKQRLVLVREPDNPHDENAVKVMSEDGKQLGYLNSRDSKDVQAILKGTSPLYRKVEAVFIEYGITENRNRERYPFCEITIRKYYKEKTDSID